MFKKKDTEKAPSPESGKSKSTRADRKVKTPKRKKETKPYDPSLNISPTKGSKKKKKRKGMGAGTGAGKTAGRGQKGQKARSGGKSAVGFEGGQMPLQRRIPKRGFVNIFKEKFSLVNLDKLNKFEASENVDRGLLFKKNIISNQKDPVKLLGKGILEKPLTIQVNKASKNAIEKVEKAGGKVILVVNKILRPKWEKKIKKNKLPRNEKKMKKKAEALEI